VESPQPDEGGARTCNGKPDPIGERPKRNFAKKIIFQRKFLFLIASKLKKLSSKQCFDVYLKLLFSPRWEFKSDL
jgi:hypothetical protein